MDEILKTKINIKFWKSKLGLEIKRNAIDTNKIQDIYVSYRHNINLLNGVYNENLRRKT